MAILYSMSEYIFLSFVYNHLAIRGDLSDQVFYRKLLALVMARSVDMEISLIKDPFPVFESVIKEKLAKEDMSFFAEERWSTSQAFFREIGRFMLVAYPHERMQKIIQAELMACAENKIAVLTLEDAAYPEKLRQGLYPSPVLYVQGRMPSFKDLEQSVALIGMHEPDGEHAPTVALGVASALEEKAWWNISGLAKGCDTLGHVASIQLEGRTGAIVPFGLAAHVDPLENTLLAKALVDEGGFLMSERLPTRPASRLFSILRNRIQSALTTALFVLETDYASSTLTTVDESLKLNKTVFVYDPVGEDGPPDHMLAGNRLLLSLKEKEKEEAFQFDSYKNTHIVGVSSLETFYDWLSYMNGDDREDRLDC